jgi:hypothetical protein
MRIRIALIGVALLLALGVMSTATKAERPKLSQITRAECGPQADAMALASPAFWGTLEDTQPHDAADLTPAQRRAFYKASASAHANAFYVAELIAMAAGNDRQRADMGVLRAGHDLTGCLLMTEADRATLSELAAQMAGTQGAKLVGQMLHADELFHCTQILTVGAKTLALDSDSATLQEDASALFQAHFQECPQT